MKLLINQQAAGSYENANIGYICKEIFEEKYAKDNKIANLGTIVTIQVNKEVLHLAYTI